MSWNLLRPEKTCNLSSRKNGQDERAMPCKLCFSSQCGVLQIYTAQILRPLCFWRSTISPMIGSESSRFPEHAKSVCQGHALVACSDQAPICDPYDLALRLVHLSASISNFTVLSSVKLDAGETPLCLLRQITRATPI